MPFDWRTEGQTLLLLTAAFIAALAIPFDAPRFEGALHEAFALLPALRQVVTSQKDVLCLFGATRCRVIDVVVEPGARRAVRGDHQARGDDGHGSVRHGLAREQALDQADEEQHQRPYHQAHHAVERAGQERAGKAGEAGRQ